MLNMDNNSYYAINKILRFFALTTYDTLGVCQVRDISLKFWEFRRCVKHISYENL